VTPTSSDRADKRARVAVTSSNYGCEAVIRATSLPLPDLERPATNSGDHPRQSTPHRKLDSAHSLPADAKNSRRPVCGHVTHNGGDQSAWVFDNRVYSPGGSTCSRCSGDDDDDDETVTSHYDQSSPIVSPQLTREKYAFFHDCQTINF